MATRYEWKPYHAEFPSANAPALLLVNRRPVLAYDAGTDETAYFSGIVPQGFTGTPTLVVRYMMASATSGTFKSLKLTSSMWMAPAPFAAV